MNLNSGDSLTIRDSVYSVCEHPAVKGIAYGQEGRAGTVYQLRREDGSLWALKVFKPRFRKPALVRQASQIGAFGSLPGLKACQRMILTTSQDKSLLQDYPDLLYAALMPWVEGSTWQDVLLTGTNWGARTILRMVRNLIEMLVQLEENGIAHGDLAAGNIIFSLNGEVQLIDLEGLFAAGLVKPDPMTGGSPGYAHQTAAEGLWQAEADRFSGALLIAEILGWASPNISAACWGESYFSLVELQQDCERYRLLCGQLEQMWGSEVVQLFQRAWVSGSVEECPTFAEWLLVLPAKLIRLPERVEIFVAPGAETPVQGEPSADPELTPLPQEGKDNSDGGNDGSGAIRELMQAARRRLDRGDMEGALELYRAARFVPGISAGQEREIFELILEIEKQGVSGATEDASHEDTDVKIERPDPLPGKQHIPGWVIGLVSAFAVMSVVVLVLVLVNNPSTPTNQSLPRPSITPLSPTLTIIIVQPTQRQVASEVSASPTPLQEPWTATQPPVKLTATSAPTSTMALTEQDYMLMIDNPIARIEAYWEASVSANYSTSWQMLTQGYKDRKYDGSFNAYASDQEKMNNCKITIENPNIKPSNVVGQVVVSTRTIFYSGSNCTAFPNYLDYHLEFDDSDGIWKIEKVTTPN